MDWKGPSSLSYLSPSVFTVRSGPVWRQDLAILSPKKPRDNTCQLRSWVVSARGFPNIQGGLGSVRFGCGSGVQRFERFRFSVPAVPLPKRFFSLFQYSLTGKDGSGFGSWKTVPAVPVPLSVSGKTVPTVAVPGSGSVPEPPWIFWGDFQDLCFPWLVLFLASEKSGKKRAHKLKKNAWGHRPGHPAGQTGVYRPVSQGFPVNCCTKTDRKGHFFCGTPAGCPRDTRPSRGSSEILWDFSYVPFLLSKKRTGTNQ